MLRETLLIPMENNRSSVTRNVGLNWVYLEMRDPLPGDCDPWHRGHPNGPRDGLAMDGHRNPGGRQPGFGPREDLETEVRYLWEPHLISVSAKVSVTGAVSTALTDEILADFVSYELFADGHKDPSPSDDALLTTNDKQPIAGFRSGQPGGRLIYATNAGAGYRFPRQANLAHNRCAAKYFRVWPLVLTHDLQPDATGAWTVDYEWRLYQV